MSSGHSSKSSAIQVLPLRKPGWRGFFGRASGRMERHGEQQAAAALPGVCPYSLEQILGDWEPDTSDAQARVG